MRIHVWPRIGGMRLADVRPRHIRAMLKDWTKQGLAPRTIRNAYYLTSCMFREAAIDEVIVGNPCILSSDLPEAVDKDPEWRVDNYFTRKEVRVLCSPHPFIEVDSLVTYGLLALAGLRPGEVIALRWRNYLERWDGPAGEDEEDGLSTLGRLVVARSHNRDYTKTKETRFVPIHPSLAPILKAWREWGWAKYVGRDPTPEDFIVPPVVGPRRRAPGEDMRMRSIDTLKERIEVHLAALGWRHRGIYTLRHTFITLATNDGAERELVRRATHKVPKTVLDGYTRLFWSKLCQEVSKLRMELDLRFGPLGTFGVSDCWFPAPPSEFDLASLPGRKSLGLPKGYAKKLRRLEPG